MALDTSTITELAQLPLSDELLVYYRERLRASGTRKVARTGMCSEGRWGPLHTHLGVRPSFLLRRQQHFAIARAPFGRTACCGEGTNGLHNHR